VPDGHHPEDSAPALRRGTVWRRAPDRGSADTHGS
jgi:hypothetical protein